jgi:tetratricopeptide (TPR) repeat protein
MLRSGLAVVLFACAVCSTGFTQLLARPRPVRLRVVVSYADGQDTVRNAEVELMDSVGGSSATDKKLTDQDGRVEFNTLTGSHRVRITAPDTYPYEGEFQIGSVETFHVENFRLRRKADAQQPVAEGTGMVSILRLRIPDAARKEFEKGSKAMEQQRWSESRKHFQTAIDLYSDYDLAYNGFGVASSEMHDLPAARQAFQKAIKLNDKFAGAQRNLARIMLSEHNYEEAASLLNRSLTVESTNAWALTNAAYAELQLHRFKEAAEHALQVHGLPHQGLANAHVIAAYALDALGRQKEAVAHWKQYLKEDPKGPNAKRAQGIVADLGRPNKSD